VQPELSTSSVALPMVSAMSAKVNARPQSGLPGRSVGSDNAAPLCVQRGDLIQQTKLSKRQRFTPLIQSCGGRFSMMLSSNSWAPGALSNEWLWIVDHDLTAGRPANTKNSSY
jgi:hypothetical protein